MVRFAGALSVIAGVGGLVAWPLTWLGYLAPTSGTFENTMVMIWTGIAIVLVVMGVWFLVKGKDI